VEGGHILAVTKVLNNTAQPTEANFDKTCDNPNCYLDDPYEGELFAFFLDLFQTWDNQTGTWQIKNLSKKKCRTLTQLLCAPLDRSLIWINKRVKLQSVEYYSPQGPITVQRGWWFSSHEVRTLLDTIQPIFFIF